MDKIDFAKLPVGSIVSHSATAWDTRYEKTSVGKTGWSVRNLDGTRSYGFKEGEAHIGDGSNITLISTPKIKGLPSKKDRLIVELEARLEASRSFARGLETERDTARSERDKARAEIVRLRQVIRAARGTLGNNF